MKLSTKEIIFTLIYAMISSVIIYFSVQNTIDKTNEYIDDIFMKMNLIIRDTSEFNFYNARDIQEIIDNGIIYEVKENDASNLKISLYPDRNEYGFNQGIFPEVAAKGTLIGYGQPTNLVLDNPGHFLILDRLWTFYDQNSIFNYHFLVNFKSKYIYLSERVMNLFDQPLYSNSYSNTNFLAKDIDNYDNQIKKYGYFLTNPYFSVYTGTRVVSVVSPLFEDGILVALIGIHIELDKLASTVSLYPRLSDKINIYLDFPNDDDSFYVSKSSYNYWTVYRHKYTIENLGELVATYDILLILQDNFSKYLLLLFFYFLLLANSRRYDKGIEKENELKQLLKLDSMTMLYNRRGLDDILKNNLDKYRRLAQPISLSAIDANKFKEINDTYGHQVGDNALMFIAESIKHCLNKDDFAIRMGGDEFLLVLPNHSKADAEKVNQSIIDYLNTFSKSIVGINVYITTACTEFDSSESFDQAYMRVDNMMYEQKTASTLDAPEKED